MTLDELIAREAIRDCVARVARGEDRRDAGLISGAYWPDAQVDLGIFAGGFTEYLAFVVPGSDAIPVTTHELAQSLIMIEADTARGETRVTSYHRIDMGGEHRDMVLGGRYLDRFERRGGEWRIAARTMLYDWLRNDGVSVDWSQGVLGTPFLAGHYTGAAKGDHSETFFAG
ncbi:nuclear transport factor 2 family protein [Sphingomonas sp. G-3-2-10]|uniref:nuclear transport factor 2 family protein n=1 Tax=Sphingomonas sp. G-3-2-10 TaxID=2728838 RepID=UPI00146E18A3|nr:nuclear transport factor 2 family protein [Sphingomonas sp. G-3-2-10]NML05751.1 nuclear transport factor 2 family protein [Sphingomonas sp. G-3-2-10]